MAQSFRPGDADPRLFRDALGKFATGVTVVTCATAEGPLAITANSFASVSLDPPLVLWSPARASKRFEAFVGADHFAIHVLCDDQREAASGFVADGRDFSAQDWALGAHNVPLLNGCLARFECDRHAVHDGGDHAIVVGHVTAVQIGHGRPLVFSEGSYGSFAG